MTTREWSFLHRKKNLKNALFLEGTNSLGAYFQGNDLAVNYKALLLQVRFPNLFGVALRKAHIVTELLALAGNCANLSHNSFPTLLQYL